LLLLLVAGIGGREGGLGEVVEGLQSKNCIYLGSEDSGWLFIGKTLSAFATIKAKQGELLPLLRIKHCS
jgi:hypothetical protein